MILINGFMMFMLHILEMIRIGDMCEPGTKSMGGRSCQWVQFYTHSHNPETAMNSCYAVALSW